MPKEMRGIFIIPQTPFDDRGELDEESLRREMDFCVEAGAHGIVMPVMASEFYLLSDDERKRMTDIVVKQVDGRVPVVIGTAAVNTPLAVELSRYANDAGADAVIALPPYVAKLDTDRIYAYYQAISDAIDIPIFIQNASPPMGSALSPSFIAKMAKEIEHVEYVKEETMPCGHSIVAVMEACGDDGKGVFGGAHGRWLIDELRRGAAGCMPACEVTDVHVEIYERFRRGDEEGAAEVFTKLLPYLNMQMSLGMSVNKEVLKRRGVIKSTYVRVGTAALDKYDYIELERVLKDVEPFFRV